MRRSSRRGGDARSRPAARVSATCRSTGVGRRCKSPARRHVTADRSRGTKWGAPPIPPVPSDGEAPEEQAGKGAAPDGQTRDLQHGERAADGASMTRIRRTFTWLTVGVLVLTLVA